MTRDGDRAKVPLASLMDTKNAVGDIVQLASGLSDADRSDLSKWSRPA